ncbi:MAG: helix-turn-helix domain-containing protein [Clostridia bacterium]|nr:helix-turn-helix domain-containing protein [Clostridia bacterium]
MEEFLNISLTEKEKKAYIEALAPQLPLLRATAGISQEEISNVIGISRQTYGAIERKAKKMSWNTYMALILFFDYNQKTHDIIRNVSAFPQELIRRFNEGRDPLSFDLSSILGDHTANILDSLDEQAVTTIKTVLMLEYSRCNDLSSEAVIKFFEGIQFTRKPVSEKDRKTSQAIKNIKRNG